MKTRGWKMEDGGWSGRSVLEFGRPLPLFPGRAAAFTPPESAGRLAQSKTWRQLLATLAFLGLALSASAQNYSIDWYKISGGGGASTGGVYSVSGTIGQHDAGGPMTGGSYSLTGGFCALIAVAQTPGAPTLYISHAGNSVTVYWQAVSGWSLHQNNNLTLPANWTVSSGVTTFNGTNYLILTSLTGNLFFRLSNP
jgi:hypothetical protein